MVPVVRCVLSEWLCSVSLRKTEMCFNGLTFDPCGTPQYKNVGVRYVSEACFSIVNTPRAAEFHLIGALR